MPDDPKTDPQDPPKEDPKGDPPKEDPKPDPEPTPAPADDFDKERAMATIRTQRKSEEAALKRAQEAEARLKKLEDEKLSEEEKLKRDAEEGKKLAADARETIQKANLLTELAKPEYGIVNAQAAVKLIDGVEFDDDGVPTNLGSVDDGDSLVAKFLTDNAYLKGTPQKPAAPSTDANAGGDEEAPKLTAEQIDAAEKAGMDPKEYAALSKEGGVSLADLEQAGLTGEPDKT